MLFKLICNIAIILVFLISACSEKKGPVDMNAVTFTVFPHSTPARINISHAKLYSISYKVTHPEGLDAVTEVVAKFSDSNSQVFFELMLFDDGSTINPSGKDVVAKDGIFSNTFISDSTIFAEGPIKIQAEVSSTSSEIINSQPIETLVGFNEAPNLISVSSPDTLFSGSESVFISAVVQDLDGIEDIENVVFIGRQQQINIFEEALVFQSQLAPDSGLYGAFYDSSFAAGKKGLYDLDFQAKDLSEELSNVLTTQIYLENNAPGLTNLQIPDSMSVPGSGVNTKLISIKVKDSQGLTDIDSVYFDSILPNGNLSLGNPFIMYDNGLPYNPDGSANEAGDLVANDGVYSLTIGLPASTPTGNYVFKFFARDKVNNFTIGPVDSIVVYQ
jgi:hypothetical protein